MHNLWIRISLVAVFLLMQHSPIPTVAIALTLPKPAILFTDVTAGPTSGGPDNQGVPITIIGKGFGAQRGLSTVTINGVAVARYLSWGENNANNPRLDRIVVQPGPSVSTGPIVVHVDGHDSNADHTFTPSGGTVYAVATDGADTDSCALTQPCATILHVATAIMQPGDALLVHGGAINDDEIWIRESLGQSGTSAKPKLILNYPGEQPVFSKVSRPVILDANYITFAGFRFIGGKSISVGDVTNSGNRVINNVFEGAIGYDAVGSHGDNHVIAGNTCAVDTSSVGTQGHCYYISHGAHVQLLYNTASGAPGYGIHIFDQNRSSNDFMRVIADVRIEGNVLASSPERSGLIIAMEDEGGRGNHIDGVVVRNNLFVANNFAGIAIGGIVHNVLIDHNTFYQNGRQGITIYDDDRVNGITVTNNLIEQSSNTHCVSNCSWYQIAHLERGAKAQNVSVSHNVYAPGPAFVFGVTDTAPMTGVAGFVNPAAGDFHLQSDSVAIDAGNSQFPQPLDFDGQVRSIGSAPDAGAFEFGTGASPQPTPLPPQKVFVPIVWR